MRKIEFLFLYTIIIQFFTIMIIVPSFSAEDSFQVSKTKPTIRVLSLDGGGMRSVIQADFLQSLGNEVQKSITETFHLIGGAGFGGFLAAMLTAPENAVFTWKERYTPADGKQFFLREDKDIYRKSWRSIWGLSGTRYNFDSFKEVADDKFNPSNKTTFDQSIIDTVIYSEDILRGPKIFRSWEETERFRISDIVLGAAGSASCFSPHAVRPINARCSFDDYELNDGGYFAKNITPLLIEEAKKRYPNCHYEVVSIGTGSYEKSVRHAGYELGDIFTAQADLVHTKLLKKLPKKHPDVSYTRWNPSLDIDNLGLHNPGDANLTAWIEATEDAIKDRKSEYKALVEKLKMPRDIVNPSSTEK